MAILLYKDTKIYIACPSGLATGGPELLHQLAFNLRKYLSIDAYMLYYPQIDNPIHLDYTYYHIPYVFKAEDNKKNILIVPEIFSACKLLSKYKEVRKGVWFLSIDNYYLSRLKKKDFLFYRIINKLFKILNKSSILEVSIEKIKIDKISIIEDPLFKNILFYMTNSYRGMHFLEERGVKPLYFLSEYLNEEFLNIQTDLSKKENLVVYNPKKGYDFTKKIIKRASEIKFVPIINMKRQEVIEFLKKAKVYIDFGNHPGKDRLPREAAILGCCVMTGKRGSAAFYEDVPIPSEYKFEDKEENISLIVEKIKDCFENFDERYKDFEHYREVIKKEPTKFIEDLKKIFVLEKKGN